MQNRLKSPVLWASCGALVTFIAKTYFGYELPEFDRLMELVLLVAVGLGIVNNPTDKGHF